jgi:hypothetical protein
MPAAAAAPAAAAEPPLQPPPLALQAAAPPGCHRRQQRRRWCHWLQGLPQLLLPLPARFLGCLLPTAPRRHPRPRLLPRLRRDCSCRRWTAPACRRADRQARGSRRIMGGITASLFRTGRNTVFELAYVPCTGAAHQAQHARRSSEPRTRCAPPLRQCRAAGLPAPPPAAWPRPQRLPPRGGCPSAWQRHPAGLQGGGGGRGWGRCGVVWCGVVWCQDQKEGQAALRGWGREQPALRLQQPSASRRCHLPACLPACRQMHAAHP